MKRLKPTRGTTLVEVLVVMVVFLIGILAVLQIFPGGLKILRGTRDTSVAASLARSESERLKGRSDQLPEMILPVRYLWDGAGVTILADSERRQSELGPVASTILANGNVLDGDGNVLGAWPYLSGPNVMRRVIGEGGRVPSPRPVLGGQGWGGLMVLQFSPVVFSPQYTEFFQVYGNDLSKRYGNPTDVRARDYEYYLEDLDTDGATIYVPRSASKERRFRLAMTVWVDDGSEVRPRDIVDVNIGPVPTGTDSHQAYALKEFAGLQSGETLVSVEGDTVRLARLFDRVDTFSADPYEYQLLDTTVGVLLFNPAGFNATQRVGRGQVVPLMARVNYDVLDWRILRDEFRVPGAARPYYKLAMGSLAVKGNTGVDGKPNFGFPLSLGDTVIETDFGLLDLDSGGMVHPDSYTVDKSVGLVTFKDAYPNQDGLQIGLVLPGATSAIDVTADGRALRAMYQVTGQWAVQVLKAPTVYRTAYNRPGVAQYYVGSSTPFGGMATRIYFPWMDAGKKVQIGEIMYRRAGDATARTLTSQDFLVQATPADPLGLPYVDIRGTDPEAVGFDFTTYGYAVQRVKGASISVRVLWNPATFGLGNDPVANMEAFRTWLGGWRQVETDTFLQRSGD